MKRLHVHVAVDDVAESVSFYSVLFAAEPQGVAWETFFTSGESTVYGDSPDLAALGHDAGCCTPQTLNGECCPPKADRAADAPCCAT